MDLVLQNIISPPILFFALGVLATLLNSDLKIPDAAGAAIAVFVLISIGLRAGVSVNQVGVGAVALPALLAVITGILLAILVYSVFTGIVRLDKANAASLAGHYGAVSSITLALSLVYLDNIGASFEQFVPALYPFMDIAALITAVVLGRIGGAGQNGKNKTELRLIYEAIVSKPSLLLLGGFIIGFANGAEGTEAIMPFYALIFPGVLTLFMLDVGLLAGSRLPGLLAVDKKVFAVGLILPAVHGLIAVILATVIGLSPGGATIFAALAAGASYISAPSVMRTAIPKANPSLSLAMALGLVFPFNVTVGIPLYYQAAQLVSMLFTR
ncbi:sodium-dependent bicarbonate transport family permease [Dethiobacter alkaliphilus]|uniref:sodium-dependent bicarbonate transport family permease n=1 Tax=Dethiobacter alkaliphilus TaxID=427926 RepID=UPI001FB1134F|nr:sodium-dependent bicarbonate transport family permease [Dethiobacter alkaliphilus]